MKYLKLIILIFIFYACQEQNNKEKVYFEADHIQSHELEPIHELILNKFKKLDAHFFTNDEQDIFESYVNNFFKTAQDSCIPIYFDDIHQGCSTLRFNVKKLNFQFFILRNNLGKFYYIGQTDKWLCQNLIESYFKNQDKDTMILTNHQLPPFSLTEQSSEVKVLNKFLAKNNKNLFFHPNSLFFQLFYEMYKSTALHSNILQVPDFKIIVSYKERFSLDTIDKKKIYTGIEHSRDSIGNIQFYKRNFGLFSWKLNYSEKRDTFYSVEKYFIPSRKIDKKYF